MSNLAVTPVTPARLDSFGDVAVEQNVAQRRPGRLAEIFRKLGVPALCRVAVWVLDVAGVAYVLHGMVPVIGAITFHLPPTIVLVASGNPTVLHAEAGKLAFWLFLAISLPRTTLGDVFEYLLARNGVQYVKERRRAKKHRRRRAACWLGRKLRTKEFMPWLVQLRGPSLMIAVFGLKLLPWTPIPAAVVAGAAHMKPRVTLCVIGGGALARLVYFYLISKGW